MSVFVEQHLAMPGSAKYDDIYIFCCAFIFTTFTFQIYAFDRLHSTPGSSQPSHGTLVVIAATSNLPPGDTDV